MLAALPIHLYALLAAAVAVMTVAIGNNLYSYNQGWFKRWLPFFPALLAVIHIEMFIIEQFLACRSFDVAFHGVILSAIVFIGGRVYKDHLDASAVKPEFILPALD